MICITKHETISKRVKNSVITTKRAYEDLERDGFIITVPGKESFVVGKNIEFIKEENLRVVEQYLKKAVDVAKVSGIEYEELKDTNFLKF